MIFLHHLHCINTGCNIADRVACAAAFYNGFISRLALTLFNKLNRHIIGGTAVAFNRTRNSGYDTLARNGEILAEIQACNRIVADLAVIYASANADLCDNAVGEKISVCGINLHANTVGLARLKTIRCLIHLGVCTPGIIPGIGQTARNYAGGSCQCRCCWQLSCFGICQINTHGFNRCGNGHLKGCSLAAVRRPEYRICAALRSICHLNCACAVNGNI